MRPLITKSVAVVTYHTKSSDSKPKTASSGSDGAVNGPRSPLWNPPAPCAPYWGFYDRAEENDLENGGRYVYPLKPLQAFAVDSAEPYLERTNEGWDRSPHPVLKSERFKLERQIAPLPHSPELTYTSSAPAPERIRRASSKTTHPVPPSTPENIV